MSQAEDTKIRNDGVVWEPRPTLASADYASLDVWEQERERIWWGDWICVGRTEEVANPGDYIVRDVAGESVFVTRNLDGELRAFYNVCAHRGTKFLDDVEGTASVRKAFVCPYHAWTFDLNGQLDRHAERQGGRALRPRRAPAVRHRGRPLRRASCSSTWPADAAAADGGPHRRRGVHHRRSSASRWTSSRGRAPRVRGRRELEDRGGELQRVPALPPDPPRARPGRPALPLRRGLGRGDARRRQLDGRGRHRASPQTGRASCPSFPDLDPRTTGCTSGATSSRTSC